MRNPSANPLSVLLGRVASQHGLGGCADSDLLERFAVGRSEQAFRALVDRHGPLVWGVCSRILPNHQDAEDAFQATFVALAQKAATGPRIGLVPAWLHEVARRASLSIRRATTRRREVGVEMIPEPRDPGADPHPGLAEVLDEEVGRLPSRLREPFILCHLQERTYEEAAGQLGYSVSTVCRRVAEACDLLRERMTRRGVAPAGTAAGLLLAGPAVGAVPPGVAARAVRVSLAAGEATGPTALAAGSALRSMAGGKMKSVAAGLVALSVAGAVAVAVALGPAAPPQPAPIRLEQPAAAPAEVRRDRFGDPLPAGAVARIGTLRFRADRGGSGDVAFLAGGRTVASVNGRAEVLVWDTDSGQVTDQFGGPDQARWIATTPDGRRLAVAGRTEVWVWDMTAARPRLAWKWTSGGGDRGLTALAFARDGRMLAVGDPGETCTRLLDGDTGSPVGVLDGCPTGQLAFSPDGKALAGIHHTTPMLYAAFSGRLLLWDLSTGWLVEPLSGRPAASFAFAPDGRSLAYAGPDGAVTVWDREAGRPTADWQAGCLYPFLAYLPGGTVAEFGSDRIIFRDPATGRETRPAAPAADLGITGGAAYFAGKELSPDGKRLATAVSAYTAQVAIWDVQTGQEVGPTGRVHGSIASMAFAPDGRTLTTLSGVNAVARTWDAETGKPGTCLTLASGREWLTGRVVYDPAGRPHAFRLRPGGEPFQLVSWDPATGAVGGQLEVPTDHRSDKFATHAVSADGRWLAGCFQGVVTLTDRTTGREVRKLKPQVPSGGFISMAFSADGQTLIVYSQHTRVAEAWETETGRRRAVLNLPPNSLRLLPRQLAVSGDGRWLAVTSQTPDAAQTVELWEVASGRPGQRLSSDVSLYCPTFSPDGRHLAAGAEDGSMREWDLATGSAAAPRRGHRARVVTVAYSPNGRRLASGSIDGTGLVWDVPPAEPATPTAAAAQLWEVVAGPDAAAAHRAGFALAGMPADAVPVLAARLAPAAGPAPEFARPAAVRGVAVIERINTPAARRVLEELSGRQADEPLAREAADALRRLAPRPGPAGP